MDFTPTEAQHDLTALTRELLTGRAAAPDRADGTGFDRELWTRFAKAGLLDIAVPNELGGSGFGVLEQCAVLVEIGRAVAPIPYAAAIAVGVGALARFGTPEQFERWAAPVLRGEGPIAPVLSTEFGALTAVRNRGTWRITGSSSVVTAGAHADSFLVQANTAAGPLLAMLDRHTPGLVVRSQRVVDAADAALLEFHDVVVPGDAIVGDRHSGDTAVAWAHRHATLAACAYQLGNLDRALRATADYALTRHQFGKPIGAFQAVRQRLADALIDVDAVRLPLWRAAWLESESRPCAPELAVAAFWAAEAGHRVAHTAVHVHASTGIYLDHPLHRHFLAAKRVEFTLSGATTHLRALGAHLAQAT
ncbi:acyl-CoA dehydrogenase family protein [Nocardia sp. NPDC055321]